MDKEKFEQAKIHLIKVLRKQGNYTYDPTVDGKISDVDATILARFDDLIIDAARELVTVADAENPCNCRQSKNFKQIIEDAAERVKNFDNKKMAAVIIAPLEDILAATD